MDWYYRFIAKIMLLVFFWSFLSTLLCFFVSVATVSLVAVTRIPEFEIKGWYWSFVKTSCPGLFPHTQRSRISLLAIVQVFLCLGSLASWCILPICAEAVRIPVLNKVQIYLLSSQASSVARSFWGKCGVLSGIT